MASSVCGLGYIAFRSFFNSIAASSQYGCYYICNAMLCGAVSVAASCHGIEVWQAVLISFISCLIYSLGSRMLTNLEIDDPLESSLIYGLQGIWGIMAVGLFDANKGLLSTGDATQLMVQLTGVVAVAAVTAIISFCIFLMVKRQQRLRVGKIYEIVGLDTMTKPSDFDDLITIEILSRIETRQRTEADIKKKSQRYSF